MKYSFQTFVLVACCQIALHAGAQEPGGVPPGSQPPFEEGRPPGGRGGPPFGPGGMSQERKVLKQFDKDGDKRLNAEERKLAREFLAKESAEGRGPRGPGGGRGPGGFGGPGRGGGNQEPPQSGPKLLPSDVKSFPDAPLYDAATLRTLFLEFENTDWEKELADFYHTDVEVPATLTADGKTYRDVGVHFRGASSFGMVGEGRKRSLNLSLDDVHEDQELHRYRTLNLLNAANDPTFLRAVLYSHIAREYIPAPKANFMRVAINGESWGIYVNQQQFNKDFLRDFFGTTKGVRWQVPGSPGGRGSLAYLGDDPAKYKGIYEIKTKEDEKSWADLIKLCKVLNETPADQLETALSPLLDIDGALKFLAIENTLINTDGYWTRTSDYSLYQDLKGGRFHIIPHDMNEGFKSPEGRGPGGPRGGGFRGGPPPDQERPDARVEQTGTPAPAPPRRENLDLDPLVAANDTNKPLISKLLAVPALRTRYLSYVRDIAEKWLDWEKLGPLAQCYQSVIAEDVKTDTRKLASTEAFTSGVAGEMSSEPGGRGPGRNITLKNFADQRRSYLLSHPEIKKLPR